MNKQSIAIFASGTGTNAENLIRFFNDNSVAAVDLLVCNKADAPVVEKAKDLDVEVFIADNNACAEGNALLERLKAEGITWIILAGFLRKVPLTIINAYRDRIINIHPALLPKFGGQGMYGRFVHEAVIAAKETESGITIHLVDEEFDKGEVLAQFSVTVTEDDTPETVAQKVRELEHRHFAVEAERIIKTKS